MVNYWASWCTPCRAEHPNLQFLAENGFPIIGINYKDEEEHALSFLGELGNPYQVIGTDKNGRTALEWGVYGIPETFIVNEQERLPFDSQVPLPKEHWIIQFFPKLKKLSSNDGYFSSKCSFNYNFSMYTPLAHDRN